MEKLNYQEWQDLIGGIDNLLFEELCYRLLTKLNYEEVKPRGGSSDGGRDLEGQKTRLEGDNKTKYVLIASLPTFSLFFKAKLTNFMKLEITVLNFITSISSWTFLFNL